MDGWIDGFGILGFGWVDGWMDLGFITERLLHHIMDSCTKKCQEQMTKSMQLKSIYLYW